MGRKKTFKDEQEGWLVTVGGKTTTRKKAQFEFLTATLKTSPAKEIRDFVSRYIKKYYHLLPPELVDESHAPAEPENKS